MAIEIKSNLKPKTTYAASLISELFESRTLAHVFHLQTKSFAEHKALNEYYDEIIDKTDRFAESFQGKYGIITGYKTKTTVSEYSDPISYFKTLVKSVESCRTYFESDGYLQQIIDEIIELLYSTIYKLVNLK